MSSTVFGDTMVPTILLLGYSILYKEIYDLTRFNHKKNATQVTAAWSRPRPACQSRQRRRTATFLFGKHVMRAVDGRDKECYLETPFVKVLQSSFHFLFHCPNITTTPIQPLKPPSAPPVVTAGFDAEPWTWQVPQSKRGLQCLERLAKLSRQASCVKEVGFRVLGFRVLRFRVLVDFLSRPKDLLHHGWACHLGLFIPEPED